MATTSLGDAFVFPQAEGTGLGKEDQVMDAAASALLSQYLGGEYVGDGLTFTNHDAANDTVDVQPGFCFIQDDATTSAGQRGSNGNAQVQSTTISGYDTELPSPHGYLVLVPSTVTVDCTDSALNQVWVNITDLTETNAVELRTDGGGGTTTEPSDTYLKLGETNPDDATADTRANDGATVGDADTLDGNDSTAFGFLADSETVTGQWTFDSGIQLPTDTNIYFGTNDEFALRYDSSDNAVQVIGDPNGTSPTYTRLDPDGKIRPGENLVCDRGDIVVDSTEGLGYEATSGASTINRYVLKYGSAGSIGDTDDVMVTNREAGGRTLIAANNGSGGGEAVGIVVPAASNPTPNHPNGVESGGDPVPKSSQGTEYDIQKNGADGAGVINFKT